jgi:hypothetical protein
MGRGKPDEANQVVNSRTGEIGTLSIATARERTDLEMHVTLSRHGLFA